MSRRVAIVASVAACLSVACSSPEEDGDSIDPRFEVRLFPTSTLVLAPGQVVSLELGVFSPSSSSWGGEVTIEVDELPDGVTAGPLMMRGNTTDLLVLRVAEDAVPTEYQAATVSVFNEHQTVTFSLELRVVPELVRGMVDHAFGVGGVVGPSHWSHPAGVILEPDGHFLLASQLRDEGHDIELLRFNADGSLDEGYGDAGVAFVDRPMDVTDEFGSQTVLADPEGGALVFAGGVVDSREMGYLYRVTDQGAVSSPIAFEPVLGSDWHEMALDTQGRVILVGDHFSGPIVARFTADGALDPSFGDEGVVIDPMSNMPDGWIDVAMLGDDAIVVGSGYALEDGPYVGRVSASQAPQVVAIAYYTYACCVATDGAGRIVVGAGFTDVARLGADLVVDTTFGDPWADIDAASSTSSLHVLPGGEVLVGGANYDGHGTLVHLGADGNLVPFGLLTSQVIPVLDYVSGMAMMADGHLLLVGGKSTGGIPRSAVTRIVL